MNNFFENHFIIECENISFEEENEIVESVRVILRRKKKNRPIRLFSDFVGRDL